MDRDVTSLPIPPSLKNKLLDNGFKSSIDLKGLRPIELSKEIGVSPQDALRILKTIKATNTSNGGESSDQTSVVPKDVNVDADAQYEGGIGIVGPEGQKDNLSGTLSGATALNILAQEVNSSHIVTFSEQIDNMLGGGVPTRKITEFCGVPGIGKTQMGFQLAVNVSIPREFGGVEGSCIYIDTEGSFMAERLVEVATHLHRHLSGLALDKTNNNTDNTTDNNIQTTPAPVSVPTVKDILSHITYYRVHDYIEEIALLNILPRIIREHGSIKLIVIDSIAFHFRHGIDMGTRSRLLQNIAHSLIDIAETYHVAVVLINQVTTRLKPIGGAVLIPALGESWGHACSLRVMLYWQQNMRYAHLMKSPTNASTTVTFAITPAGIRDVETLQQ